MSAPPLYRSENIGELIVITGPMCSGKCLGKDTPILMYDGTIKMVQDVKADDEIMGNDSTPRNVLGTTVGTSDLYKVTPSFGEPYIVNEHHILSLKCSYAPKKYKNTKNPKYKKGKVVNIDVKSYINESNTFKSYYKGYRVGIDFQKRPTELDPYILGAWLGDGTSREPEITTVDPEILNKFTKYALSVGLKVKRKNNDHRAPTYRITSGQLNGYNPFIKSLEMLNVRNNKHIPLVYKANTRKIRMKVLAGLLDTDGYYDETKHVYEIVQKRKILADDICYVARSLGFASYVNQCTKYCIYKGQKRVGTYHRVSISGSNLDEIPVKLKRKKAVPHIARNDLLVGIKVENIGQGDYYGFELDGNHLFLLGDFTVTHNTTETLRRLFCETKSNMKCLYINHTQDTRSKNPFSTHNPLFKDQLSKIQNIDTCSTDSVALVPNILTYDVIAIDELQFFDECDVYEISKLVEEEGKIVIATGLNLDFQRKKYITIELLTPYADEYVLLHARCENCGRHKTRKNAIFTHRKFASQEQLLVGGKGMYVPLCRGCYLHFNAQKEGSDWEWDTFASRNELEELEGPN